MTSCRHVVDNMHLVVKEILKNQTLKGKNATTQKKKTAAKDSMLGRGRTWEWLFFKDF